MNDPTTEVELDGFEPIENSTSERPAVRIQNGALVLSASICDAVGEVVDVQWDATTRRILLRRATHPFLWTLGHAGFESAGPANRLPIERFLASVAAPSATAWIEATEVASGVYITDPIPLGAEATRCM